jgi:probable rRNA maturation factor
MDPSSRRSPATAGLPDAAAPPGPAGDIDVLVADTAWRRWLRAPEAIVRRAAAAAGGGATVVLDSDAAVKRLNARHRARNKPTNVLTFEPAAPGLPGEIVLALGTVRREAQAAGRRGADHLAHLVVHGMLHLRGHDHALAGAARRMEMAETRLLHRLRRPNPWRFGGVR